MSDSVGQYLNEIGAVALLTAEEERMLSQTIERGRAAAARIEAGERSRELRKEVAEAAAAKDRFIRANLRLVVSVARRYPLPPGMELLDLIQEGNLGLEHAVDKFDWRKGFKFSTYATFWIRQAIGRALDQKASLIRIPGDRSASLRAALRQASGDGETLDQQNAELHRLTTPVSLDKTVGDDGDATLGDLMANGEGTPEDHVMSMVDSDLLDELLGTLDARARYAVEARFGLLDGERKSFREVGESLGVTAEAARRLVSRAVAGLRECRAQHRANTPKPVWNPDIPNPIDFWNTWQEVPDNAVFENAFKIQWELFLKHVVRDEPFRWDMLEGAKGVQLAELGLRSWAERRWLDVAELSLNG